MIVDERIVTYMHSLEKPNNNVLEEIEQQKSAFYRTIPIEMDDENEGGDIAFNRVEVQEEPDMENQYENISAVKELTYEEMMIEERKVLLLMERKMIYLNKVKM